MFSNRHAIVIGPTPPGTGVIAPATALAGDVANAMRDLGVLISTDGPFDNVLKIKPPIVFDVTHADVLADALSRVLGSFTP